MFTRGCSGETAQVFLPKFSAWIFLEYENALQ